MSTRYYVTMELGGTLSKEDLAKLVEAVEDEDLFDGDGCLPAEEAYILDAIDSGSCLKVCDSQSNGSIEGLRTICQELGLIYNECCEGSGECDPCIIYWSPGMAVPETCETDNGHDPVISKGRVSNILKNGGGLEEILKHLHQVPNVPPLVVI